MLFLNYKKDKQYLKYFKDFKELKDFLEGFGKDEIFSILKKNAENLKLFKKEIQEYSENLFDKDVLEDFLNFMRLKNKFSGKKEYIFLKLLQRFKPLEVYKVLKQRKKKKFLFNI